MTERQQEIERLSKELAYCEARTFFKEVLIKALTDETRMLMEFEKLEVLYACRNELKKQLEDL